MTELVKSRGGNAEYVSLWGASPEFTLSVVGDRYITFSGPNCITSRDGEYTVFEDQMGNWFRFYFNAKTSDELFIDDLFLDGWENETKYYYVTETDGYFLHDENAVEYTAPIDVKNRRIINISEYNYAVVSETSDPYSGFVYVYFRDDSSTVVVAAIPNKYIK